MSWAGVVSKPVGYHKSSNYLLNHEGENYAAHSARKLHKQTKNNPTLNPYHFKKDETVCCYFISFHLLSLFSWNYGHKKTTGHQKRLECTQQTVCICQTLWPSEIKHKFSMSCYLLAYTRTTDNLKVLLLALVKCCWSGNMQLSSTWSMCFSFDYKNFTLTAI